MIVTQATHLFFGSKVLIVGLWGFPIDLDLLSTWIRRSKQVDAAAVPRGAAQAEEEAIRSSFCGEISPVRPLVGDSAGDRRNKNRRHSVQKKVLLGQSKKKIFIQQWFIFVREGACTCNLPTVFTLGGLVNKENQLLKSTLYFINIWQKWQLPNKSQLRVRFERLDQLLSCKTGSWYYCSCHISSTKLHVLSMFSPTLTEKKNVAWKNSLKTVPKHKLANQLQF